jgi:hypothetical protein
LERRVSPSWMPPAMARNFRAGRRLAMMLIIIIKTVDVV